MLAVISVVSPRHAIAISSDGSALHCDHCARSSCEGCDGRRWKSIVQVPAGVEDLEARWLALFCAAYLRPPKVLFVACLVLTSNVHSLTNSRKYHDRNVLTEFETRPPRRPITSQ